MVILVGPMANIADNVASEKCGDLGGKTESHVFGVLRGQAASKSITHGTPSVDSCRGCVVTPTIKFDDVTLVPLFW